MKLTKLKKHLAMLLSAAMVLSCVPATAMAAEEADVEAAEFEEAVETEDVLAEGVEEEEIAEEVVDSVEEEVVSASADSVPTSWNFRSGSEIMGEKGVKIEGKTGTTAGLFVDATTGKFDSTRTDWAQVNKGTKIYIPVSGPSEITIGFYSAGVDKAVALSTVDGKKGLVDEKTAVFTTDGSASANGIAKAALFEMAGNDYIGTITVKSTSWNFRSGSEIMGEKGVKIEGKTGTTAGLFVDATAGKFDSTRSDWAQVNTGTKIYIPVSRPSKLEIEFYSASAAGAATVDGAKGAVEGKTAVFSTKATATAEGIDKAALFEMKANDYIGSIKISPITETLMGDAYISKTFAAAPVVSKEAGLAAKIYKQDGTLVDTVSANGESMYMGNSSNAGQIGKNKVGDNLIWVDDKTLVITPHNNEKGYPFFEPGEKYYVVLDEGLVKVNGADAGIKTKTDWEFTATAPEGLTDRKVINVGSGDGADFRTLTGAFNYLRKNTLDGDWTINVEKGTYHERPFYYGNANITIKGASETGKFGKDVLYTWKNVDDWTEGGARGRSTFLVQGNGSMNMLGISMVNTYDRKADGDDGSTQAETLAFDSTGNLFVYDCGFDSHQDTLYIGKDGNRSWFYKSYIAGDVDFLWGYPGVCLFEECTLRAVYDAAKDKDDGKTPQAHLIASRTNVEAAANLGANKGFVIMNSTVKIDDKVLVNYARNSGSDSNAAILNNVFDSQGKTGKVMEDLYGSAPGYEVKDANKDVVVGYMDGDNYTDSAKKNKIATDGRRKGCDALAPRIANREYSGRYVILNRGYDFKTNKFVTAAKKWDAAALAKSFGITPTADNSEKQIFIEPVAYKNVVGGKSVSYNAFDISGNDITKDVTWEVAAETDGEDPNATGNTADKDAKMNAEKKGQLDTKLLTRSTVEVKASKDGKYDSAYCYVIPQYVPADTLKLRVVKGSMNLYGTRILLGALSCSTNSRDEVSVTTTTWTTSDKTKALFYDEVNKKLVDTLTTETCKVKVYAAGSGKVTVTAKTEDGGTDTAELTIYDDQVEWTPFTAGIFVNTDVQSGKWGTFNGIQIDAVTNNKKNGNTAKVAMKTGNDRMQTRNVILSIPSDKDATLKVTLESAPGAVATKDTADSLAYQGLYADGTNIIWDEATLTYTVNYKAADAKTASLTAPEGTSANANTGTDAGIDTAELAKKQYLQLVFGSSDVYVKKYVLTKTGHTDVKEEYDESVPMEVLEIKVSKELLQLEEGQSEKVGATVKFEDETTSNNVQWASKDASIATVAEDGTITAVKEGNTIVTATYGEESAEVEVYVKKGTGGNGGNEGTPSENTVSDNKTEEQKASDAKKECKGAAEDTIGVINTDPTGKAPASVDLTQVAVGEDGVARATFTIAKGSKVQLTGYDKAGSKQFSAANKAVKKNAAINGKGLLIGKNPANIVVLKYALTGGKAAEITVNIMDVTIAPGQVSANAASGSAKKLAMTYTSAGEFDIVVNAPLTANVIDAKVKAKGVVLQKVKNAAGVESNLIVGSDGKLHIRGTIAAKQSASVPINVYGKKLTIKIKSKIK